MQLRKRSRINESRYHPSPAPRLIGSYAVRAVTGDDSQSAHKPTAASWSRTLSRFRTHTPSDLAPLLSIHGTNKSKAVSSQGTNFPWLNDALGVNRQMAKIIETQTAEQTAVILANRRTGSRNAPAAT